MIKQVATLSLILLTSGCLPHLGKVENESTLHFIPFEIDTFFPVTKGSIEDDARCAIALLNANQMTKLLLLKLSSGKKENFYDGLVRLKLVRPNEDDIYVDQLGIVTSGTSSRKLSENDFKELDEIVTKLIADSGCNPNKLVMDITRDMGSGLA